MENTRPSTTILARFVSRFCSLLLLFFFFNVAARYPGFFSRISGQLQITPVHYGVLLPLFFFLLFLHRGSFSPHLMTLLLLLF